MPELVDGSRAGDGAAGARDAFDVAGAGAIEVLVSEARWRRAVPNAERLVRRAACVARAGSGSVVLAGDLAVRRLNARHRGRNKPTNVLTFPTDASGGGDIVLAFGVVRREARAAGRPVSHHLAHLVLHGLLHLSGHDHGEAGPARRMEREEARLLSRLGVPNPWKPRAGAPR